METTETTETSVPNREKHHDQCIAGYAASKVNRVFLIHVNTLQSPYNFVQRVPEGISGNPGKQIQDSTDACLTLKSYISY
jgi:hypothetical protein